MRQFQDHGFGVLDDCRRNIVTDVMDGVSPACIEYSSSHSSVLHYICDDINDVNAGLFNEALYL